MEHDEVYQRITSILDGEDDWVTAMATVVCELHNAFEHYHWTGFYRTTEPNVLKIGPYQGGHGCLVIPFDKGICGAAARTGETQDVPDVHVRPEHIACSSSNKQRSCRSSEECFWGCRSSFGFGFRSSCGIQSG